MAGQGWAGGRRSVLIGAILGLLAPGALAAPGRPDPAMDSTSSFHLLRDPSAGRDEGSAGAAPAGPASPDLRSRRPNRAAIRVEGSAATASNLRDVPAFDPMGSDVFRSDAALADVCFVDTRVGWAVGDRGTIWHTEDGGDRWDLQQSGVTCRLESVSFLNRQTGWAAGGYSHPYLHTSTGVILATADGGQHWNAIPRLLLPAIKRIRFFGERRGWAVGCPSAMFPSGAFVTDSGGRSWNALPGPRTPGWLAGSLSGVDLAEGALAGRSGLVAVVRQGSPQPAQTPPLGLRDPLQLKLIGPGCGWLVGQGGLAMVTTDAAATWQTLPGELLPQGAAGQFDFTAVEVRGSKCWVAGSPGSVVLHTPDAGRTWNAAFTGQNLPILAIAFADDENGWAVGHLGTILHTADGGRTWRRQRAGGSRVALLALFREGRDVPLELLVRLSAEEGYLAQAELLNRRDVDLAPPGDVHPADRIHEALAAVGACGARTAWRFPLRQSGLGLALPQVVETWDRLNEGRGLAQLEAHLVQEIRLWRPDVILTHDPNGRTDEPVAGLIGQAVVQAAQRAADPGCCPEQIALAGLTPWQVKKVYASLPPGSAGPLNVLSSQWAGRLGRSLSDLAAGPRGLVADRYQAPAPSLGFYLITDRAGQAPERDDFFDGLSLAPGCGARRMLLEPLAEAALTVHQIAQRRRTTQAVLDRVLRDPQKGADLLAEAGALTRQLDADSAAQILFQIAESYYRAGQWTPAAEAFEMLVDRHAEHPLARPALVWLVHYCTSAEAQWRVRVQPRATIVGQVANLPGNVGQVANLPRNAGDVAGLPERRVDSLPQAGWQPAPPQPLRPAPPQPLRPDAPPGPPTDDAFRRSAALASRLEQTRPDLLALPTIGYSLAALDRRRGQGQQAERFYLAQRRSMNRDAWWTCAQGEGWLANPKGPPPKPVACSVPAPVRPRLDGELDDPVWQAAKPIELRSLQNDDAQWPASVMLAYDDQFLYVAIRARQAPGCSYHASSEPRPRDPDLSARDRVEICLDVDRDYSTYWRLVIDHRGWAADACGEDATWDPHWFVAAGGRDGQWTAEAAIPLGQLTGSAPTPNTVWAIGVQRVVPGVGFQSFSTPAAVEPIAEGFGYMIFE